MSIPVLCLVDDEPVHLTIAEHSVKAAGVECQVVTVTNGKEYIEGLEQGLCPALTLLDWKMPVMDGFEVLRSCKAEESKWKEIPIVVLTTSDREKDLVRSLELHANAFIRKPVGGDDVRDAIRVLGDHWLDLVERRD